MTDLEQQISEISSAEDIIRILETHPKLIAAKKAAEDAEAKAAFDLTSKKLNNPAMQRRIPRLNNAIGSEVRARPDRWLQDVSDIAFCGLGRVLSNWKDGQLVINPSDFEPGDFNGVDIEIKIARDRQGKTNISWSAQAPAKQRALKILYDLYCTEPLAQSAGTRLQPSGGISNGIR